MSDENIHFAIDHRRPEAHSQNKTLAMTHHADPKDITRQVQDIDVFAHAKTPAQIDFLTGILDGNGKPVQRGFEDSFDEVTSNPFFPNAMIAAMLLGNREVWRVLWDWTFDAQTEIGYDDRKQTIRGSLTVAGAAASWAEPDRIQELMDMRVLNPYKDKAFGEDWATAVDYGVAASPYFEFWLDMWKSQPAPPIALKSDRIPNVFRLLAGIGVSQDKNEHYAHLPSARKRLPAVLELVLKDVPGASWEEKSARSFLSLMHTQSPPSGEYEELIIQSIEIVSKKPFAFDLPLYKQIMQSPKRHYCVFGLRSALQSDQWSDQDKAAFWPLFVATRQENIKVDPVCWDEAKRALRQTRPDVHALVKEFIDKKEWTTEEKSAVGLALALFDSPVAAPRAPRVM